MKPRPQFDLPLPGESFALVGERATVPAEKPQAGRVRAVDLPGPRPAPGLVAPVQRDIFGDGQQ